MVNDYDINFDVFECGLSPMLVQQLGRLWPGAAP
jgi:hypothetical protein